MNLQVPTLKWWIMSKWKWINRIRLRRRTHRRDCSTMAREMWGNESIKLVSDNLFWAALQMIFHLSHLPTHSLLFVATVNKCCLWASVCQELFQVPGTHQSREQIYLVLFILSVQSGDTPLDLKQHFLCYPFVSEPWVDWSWLLLRLTEAGANDTDPGPQDPVLWRQYTNTQGLWSPVEEKG